LRLSVVGRGRGTAATVGAAATVLAPLAAAAVGDPSTETLAGPCCYANSQPRPGHHGTERGAAGSKRGSGVGPDAGR